MNTYPELTPEEKAKRARIAELKVIIKKEASDRRLIKAAYRLPHGSDENKAAMALARTACGIDPKHVYSWNAHAIPDRNYGRASIHGWHVELGNLTGKPHVMEQLQPA